MAEHYDFPSAWDTDSEAALAQPLAVVRAWRDVIREAIQSEFWIYEERDLVELDQCEAAPWTDQWPRRWHERKRDAVSDCTIVGHSRSNLHIARLKLINRYERIINLVALKELREVRALQKEAA
jgi:hypothetical protein